MSTNISAEPYRPPIQDVIDVFERLDIEKPFRCSTVEDTVDCMRLSSRPTPLLQSGGPPRYDHSLRETPAEHSLRFGLNPSHIASTIIRAKTHEAGPAYLEFPALNHGRAFRLGGQRNRSLSRLHTLGTGKPHDLAGRLWGPSSPSREGCKPRELLPHPRASDRCANPRPLRLLPSWCTGRQPRHNQC